MRAKKAKALRKLAHQYSAGMPERASLTIDTIKKVKVTNPKHEKFGEIVDMRMHTSVNNPDTFRGRYRMLKRMLKRAPA